MRAMEDQEGRNTKKKKHVCKICHRNFPCGRSLGGHMRSHGGAATSSPPPSPPPATQRKRKLAEVSYGLRENPKKTRRAYESSAKDGKEEVDLALCLMMLSRDTNWFKREKEEREESKKKEYTCKSCTKVFLTHQALGGHRASHKRSTPASSATVGESSTTRNESIGDLDMELSDEGIEESETWASSQWPPLLNV